MTPEQLKSAIDALKQSQDPNVRILLDAFMSQSLDMEGLALVYVGLIKAAGDLKFWSDVLVGTIRPASKNRCFVSKESAEKLTEAVKAYKIADGSARAEETKLPSGPVITLSETTTKPVIAK